MDDGKVEKVKTTIEALRGEITKNQDKVKSDLIANQTGIKEETAKAHGEIKDLVNAHEKDDLQKFGQIDTKLEGQNTTLRYQNQLLEKIDKKLDTKT